jgi:polysaccharide pyruvyl transferase WcaK-like protein
MRIAVLGATLETTNMGVGALAAGAIRCLLHAYPQADISFLDYAMARSVQTIELNGNKVSIPVINMRFSKRLHLPNNIAVLLLIAGMLKMIPSKKLRQWIISQNGYLNEIHQMDVFASIAGGDSFSDISGIERPQTIGPFRGGFAKSVARYILNRAERVYSRDDRGLEELKALVGRGRAATKFWFCYDVGFVLDPILPAHIDLIGLRSMIECTKPLVGLNISGLLFMGGYTRNNMFGLRVEYQKLVDDLIEYLTVKKGASVVLVPHVFEGGPDSEADTSACERVYEKLKHKYPGRLGFLRGRYNQNQIKYIIGKCDFFIGARMHACIAAVSQCVPAVCLAYSDKFIGVMESIGVASIVADIRRLTASEVLKVVEQSLDDRAAIRQQLEQKMPEVKSSVLNLFVDLPGLAGTRTDRQVAVPFPVIADR